MSSGGSVGMAKKALQARSSNALRHSLKKKKTEAAEALSDAAAAAAYEGDDFNDDESLPIGESAGSTSPLLGNENSDDYGSGQVSVMRRRKSRGLLQRALSVDGTVVNNPSSMFDDIPTWLIQRKVWYFIFLTFISYVTVAVIFAALYMYDLNNCVTQTDVNGVVVMSDSFYDAFFFSIQTLSTVGYGSRSPTCAWSESISALECFCGLIYVAIVTGLLFGRFTRPLSRLLLSHCICIGKHKSGKRILEFRIANGHKIPALCVDATVMVSTLDPETVSRNYAKLQLNSADHPGWLSQTQTFTHIIDQSSPLFALSADEFAGRGGIVHVVVQAMNGVGLAPMVVTGNYMCGDDENTVVFGSMLASMTEMAPDGASFTVDYAKLSSHQMIDDPGQDQKPPMSPKASSGGQSRLVAVENALALKEAEVKQLVVDNRNQVARAEQAESECAGLGLGVAELNYKCDALTAQVALLTSSNQDADITSTMSKKYASTIAELKMDVETFQGDVQSWTDAEDANE